MSLLNLTNNSFYFIFINFSPFENNILYIKLRIRSHQNRNT